MTDANTVDYEQVIPDILKSMAGVNMKLAGHGFDRTIHHLVQLRASQINRCGYCVEMHTCEAREDGETGDRLDRVIVWDQVDVFTDREKAALAWTEALTDLDARADRAALRTRLQTLFSAEEIGILTGTIAMINMWNRINISRH